MGKKDITIQMGKCSSYTVKKVVSTAKYLVP